MGSHNLYVSHGRWSDFGEEVEDILDVSLSKPTDLWATATDRATAGISCAMIVRRDFDALEAELSWSIAKEGDEERTETEEKNVKTVVRRRNFGRQGRQPDRKAGTRGLQESQPQKWLCKQEKNTPSMKFHTSLT